MRDGSRPPLFLQGPNRLQEERIRPTHVKPINLTSNVFRAKRRPDVTPSWECGSQGRVQAGTATSANPAITRWPQTKTRSAPYKKVRIRRLLADRIAHRRARGFQDSSAHDEGLPEFKIPGAQNSTHGRQEKSTEQNVSTTGFWPPGRARGAHPRVLGCQAVVALPAGVRGEDSGAAFCSGISPKPQAGRTPPATPSGVLTYDPPRRKAPQSKDPRKVSKTSFLRPQGTE